MKKILKITGFTLLTLVSAGVLVLSGVGFASLFFGATSLLAPVLSAAPILAPILGSYLLTGLGGIIGLVSGIFFVRKTIKAFNNNDQNNNEIKIKEEPKNNENNKNENEIENEKKDEIKIDKNNLQQIQSKSNNVHISPKAVKENINNNINNNNEIKDGNNKNTGEQPKVRGTIRLKYQKAITIEKKSQKTGKKGMAKGKTFSPITNHGLHNGMKINDKNDKNDKSGLIDLWPLFLILADIV